MTLYAIVLNNSNAIAWENVREKWPTHHIFDDRVAFISTENALTSDIAQQAGISGETDIRGVVIQMDYFSGHTSASLVEWISKNRD